MTRGSGLSLRARLLVGTLGVALVFAIPLAVALRGLDRLRASTDQLRATDFAASLVLGRVREGVDDLRRAEDGVLFLRDADSRRALTAEVETLRGLAASLRGYELDSAARDLTRAVDEVAAAAPLLVEAAASENPSLADSISAQRMRPAAARIVRSADATERSLRARTAARVEAATDASARAQLMAGLALLLALAVAALIAYWLFRSIARPVRELERGMRAVADGDFSHRLPGLGGRNDEFGRLAQSYLSMALQLAELDKLKAEFVSVASHELKTPINVVLGYVQLLQEDIYGVLDAKQREVCGTIERQTKSLSRLVKQLLDVSRFEAGGGKLDPRRMDLREFLDDLQSAFAVLAMQRDVRFVVARADTAPADVQWDADRMNEVLGNLLSNAFKFTDRGGSVDLGVSGGGESVFMVVRDSGAGISPDQLPRIFQKFFQANNQDAASAKGTGLGLAIAKEIVEAHGGSISVESSPGVGTTFSLTMPKTVVGSRRSSQLTAVTEAG